MAFIVFVNVAETKRKELKIMAETKKTYRCSRCNKTFSETEFYTYKDGSKVKLCKHCLSACVCDCVNNFEPETFAWILSTLSERKEL
jgi:hypothetical protein